MSNKIRKRDSEIKVNIKGEISDYNLRLYNERLAMILLEELGEDNCRKLLKMLEEKE
ncbi:MAG: hypothetical protein SOY04_12625 [Clostridium celatum]|nr:hypothetical protein [Clostridium celatum]